MTELDPAPIADVGQEVYRYGAALSAGPDPGSHEDIGWDHRACIIYCRHGRRRRRRVCPGCYQTAVILDIDAYELEPVPGRAEQFAAWCGGWVTAFMAAVVFPFQRPATAEQARAELIEQAARGDHEELCAE
jgi:hypothetical protein